jgi:hypothetical protein
LVYGSIIHQYVNPTESFRGLSRQLLGVVLGSHISLCGKRLASASYKAILLSIVTL